MTDVNSLYYLAVCNLLSVFTKHVLWFQNKTYISKITQNKSMLEFKFTTRSNGEHHNIQSLNVFQISRWIRFTGICRGILEQTVTKQKVGRIMLLYILSELVPKSSVVTIIHLTGWTLTWWRIYLQIFSKYIINLINTWAVMNHSYHS